MIRSCMVPMVLPAAIVAVAALAAAACAAEPRPGLATGAWKLESLSLHDGRRLEGLVVEPEAVGERRDPTAPIGFVQIIQPPGRMMELITWPPINSERIETIERLPAAEHALLEKRVDEFRNRRGRQHAAETAVVVQLMSPRLPIGVATTRSVPCAVVLMGRRRPRRRRAR